MFASRRTLAGVGLVLGITGCGAMGQGFAMPQTPTLHAPNPLGGQALKVGGGTDADSRKCDRPFEAPGFTLTASTQEICIAETVVVERSAQSPAPANVDTIQRDISGDAPRSSIALAADGPMQRVTKCSSDAGEIVVFQQSFKGCAPNKGIILPSTKLLGLIRDDARVDGARPVAGSEADSKAIRWELSAAEPAAATAKAADGATSTTSAVTPAPTTLEETYKDDVRKCMHGEPVSGGSMVGGPTCKNLRRAAQSGDTSQLPKGAKDMFLQVRREGH